MSRESFFVGLSVAALLMISCSSSSDGEVIVPSNPDPPCSDNTGNRFVDCDNGTITDTSTGLIWLKNARCLGWQTWSEARAAAAALADGKCGLTDNSSPGDWRLPSLSCPSMWWCEFEDSSGEFASIFAPSCEAPQVLDTTGAGCWSEENPFSNVVRNDYWSGSTDKGDPWSAWSANLDLGYVGSRYKESEARTWAVRGGGLNPTGRSGR
jgi:hypothetical protein